MSNMSSTKPPTENQDQEQRNIVEESKEENPYAEHTTNDKNAAGVLSVQNIGSPMPDNMSGGQKTLNSNDNVVLGGAFGLLPLNNGIDLTDRNGIDDYNQ